MSFSALNLGLCQCHKYRTRRDQFFLDSKYRENLVSWFRVMEDSLEERKVFVHKPLIFFTTIPTTENFIV